jgi:serine/threonine protein kinase
LAVKILDISQNKEHKVEAQKETMIWKQAGKHPNVVSLLEIYEDDTFNYFVMEKCEFAMCDSLLQKKNLQEFQLLDYFREMLLGLAHCHGKGIIHRDVKPANFLVGFDGHVKLCDFGLAQLAKPGGVVGISGTAPFMSPEMLLKQPYHQKTDVFSFGATCYLMLYGKYPYQIDRNDKSRSPASLMRIAIATNCPPPSYTPKSGYPEPSDIAQAFVQVLMQRDVDARPSSSEALQLPALQHKTQPSLAKPTVFAPAASFAPAPSFVSAIQLAKKETAELKPKIDPTVVKNMDELLEQLQRTYGRGALHRDGGDFSKSFSLPDRSSSLAVERIQSVPRSHSDRVSFTSIKFEDQDDQSTCSPTGSQQSTASKLSI